MTQLTCPVCKTILTLEHIVLNETRSQLYRLLFVQPKELETAIVLYMGLFRNKRDLSDDKALSLVKQVLELHTDKAILVESLNRVVSSFRQKEEYEPLKNHNYLKSVLKTVANEMSARVETLVNGSSGNSMIVEQRPVKRVQKSKAIEGLTDLEALKGKYA
ncbi:hypothetical protein [Beggiatoa leptomitoformis]|uniref:Uncharacterized protein n=1 Tax=Beggiatoa leptomitoformis TaxID=288004 RepID=A0A2N9YHI6_9GAMM|nr:hypothetical protein [Beggiatoa leptomitoformis]ALG67890.1 hypothetical protein AL038_09430 [Beggiatoa leptomitoformis]AUI69845.1 hypothetical protein BLE401_14870 [Beggiatoa leptomitoformis]